MDDFDRDMDFGDEPAPIVVPAVGEAPPEAAAPSVEPEPEVTAATEAEPTAAEPVADDEHTSKQVQVSGVAAALAAVNFDAAAPVAAAADEASSPSTSVKASVSKPSSASASSKRSAAAPIGTEEEETAASSTPASAAAKSEETKEETAELAATLDAEAAAEEEPEMCSLCDEAPAILRCAECDMAICAGPGGCDSELHAPAKMRLHKRTYLDGRPFEPLAAAAAATAAPAPVPAAAAPADDDADEDASYGADDDFGAASMDQSFAAPSVSVAPTATAATVAAKPAPLPSQKEEDENASDDEYGDSEFGQTQQMTAAAPAAAAVTAPAAKKPAAARSSPTASAAAVKPVKAAVTKPAKPTAAASSSPAPAAPVAKPKAAGRKSATKPKSAASIAASTAPVAAVAATKPSAAAAPADDDDDYADDGNEDYAADADAAADTDGSTSSSTDQSANSALSPFFHALLQDPFHPSSLGAPVLEGMILPVTLQCRAGGRVSAVFYTDATGFVRYHAWQPARERKDEVRARGMTKPPGLRATTSREAAPLLLPFHPHATPVSLPPSASLSAAAPASQTTPAHFHPKCLDAAAVEQLDVLRMFTPQRRERNLNFLKKQRHKAKRAAQLRDQRKQQQPQAQQRQRTQQAEEKDNGGAPKDDEDTYSDDDAGDNYSDDDDQQQQPKAPASKGSSGSVAAAATTTADDGFHVDDDDDSTDAAHARDAFRAAAEAQAQLEALQNAPSSAVHKRTGQVNIEVWKREERALMQARQRAAFLAAEAERARERLEARRRAVEQECLYVALLIYTEGVTSSTSSAPLPPPEALTLGQLRLLFKAAVLAPSKSVPSGWVAPAHHDFLVQKLEYAPGRDHSMYRVEFNEEDPRMGATNVKVELATNQFRPPEGGAEGGGGGNEFTSRAHEGFRHEESCYTFKGPASGIPVHIESRARSTCSDEHRRFKKVLFNILRRIGDAGLQGRPSRLRMYFQQGVPAAASESGVTSAAAMAVGGAPDAGLKALSAPDMTSVLVLPPDARKKAWYVLFADQMTLKGGRGGAGSPVKAAAQDGGEAGSQQAAGVAPATAAANVLGAVPLLGPSLLTQAGGNANGTGSNNSGVMGFEHDASTGATLLPGIRGYEPLMLSHLAQDRTSCVKCHAKLGGSGKGADLGSLMMLRQVLLKWLPNKVYEYPEELFRDVLGVDENPMRANWHRATIVVCKNCRREINALRTIPPRTQLAPWLAAVALHGVEVAPVDLANPQVQSGTKQTGVTVPAPASLPSLLPYLSRAPAMHSSGSGHAAQLVPEVAYVARKNVTLMELTGVQGPSAGLSIDPAAELRANAARLGHTIKPISVATGSSVPVLGGAHLNAPDLARSAQDFSSGFLPHARHTLNHRGLFVMESAYLDATSLNPHQHPTHQMHHAHTAAGGGNSPSPKMIAGSKSAANLHPGAALASGSGTKRLLHSGSVGTLTSKSVVAGGAGTAPALPHRPLAPTVLFSPVKQHVAGVGGAGSPGGTKGAARTGSATRLPALAGSPQHAATSAKKSQQAKAKAATTKPTAGAAKGSDKAKPSGATAPIAAEDDADEYGTDEFGSVAEQAAEQAQYDANGYVWDPASQQYYDPNATAAAAAPAAGEDGQYDAAATAAYWAAQGYDVSGYTAAASASDAAAAPDPAVDTTAATPPAAAAGAAAAPAAVDDEEENYDDDF